VKVNSAKMKKITQFCNCENFWQ